MRIDRFVIHRYGPLAPRTLDFSAGREGLHVVHGPNEWGKSLTLQALEHTLFAIPRRIEGFSETEMRQVELELVISRRATEGSAAGPATTCAFRRTRQTLSSAPDGAPLDEQRLLGFLGGVTAESFRLMYGLSGERIREGGRLLQKAKGDIAATLFAAATGLEQVREVARGLDLRHQALFSPAANATNPRVNASLRTLRQRLAAYSGALQMPEATARLEASLRERREEFRGVEESLRRLSARAGHLARVGAARAAAVELHAARQRLAGLGSPPILVETFQERLVKAREAIARADTLEEQQQGGLARQRARRGQIVIEDHVDAAAADIRLLVASTEELAGIDTSIPEQEAELSRHSSARATLFSAIAATTGAPLRETAIRVSDTQQQIDDLIAGHGAIVEAFDQREARVAETRHAIARIDGELECMPVVGDVGEAEGRLQTVRDGGDLEKQLAAKRGEFADQAREYAAECARLEGRRTDAPVERLAVPALADVIDARDRFQGFEVARARIEEDTRAAVEEIATLRSHIALVEMEGDLPAEGRLEEARAARDAALASLASPPGPLSAAALAERVAEIARLSIEADRIVDRLLTHADRASQRRQHRVAIERLEGLVGRLGERRAELASRVDEATRAWAALWEPAQVVPKSPAAMEEWLAIHAGCRARAAGLAKLGREIDDLERALDADRGVLAGLLSEVGIVPPEGATRRHLLDAATAALKALRAKAAARQQKVDQRAGYERDLPRLQGLLEMEAKKRDAWNKRWADCMAVLDQPRGVSTETGRFLLNSMRSVVAHEEKIAAARARIAAMQERRDEIYRIARRVCDALGQAFDPRAVKEIARRAEERLHATLEQQRDRDELDAAIRESEAGLARIVAGRGAAEAALAALREEAGVDADGDLDAAWAASERFCRVRDQVDEWQQKFLREVGDRDPEAMLAACIGTTSAAIEEELAAIDRDTAVKTAERDRLRDACHDLERQVEALGGERAACLWAECQMDSAEVLERVGEYLPQRLAALALERASRRFRDEHHAPVLDRASARFERITGGRYAAIRMAENDLYAVRADAVSESVLQRFMSEGTRDQLYLALRLAALEHGHEQGAEPLPLILDDGLVHFDDARTAAMLEVLADVSGGMQVILFTHHASVVAAARAVKASRPEGVFLHGGDGV